MKIPKILKSKQGESLIEVVVSCAILGILVVVATSMLMSSIDTVTRTDRIQKGDALITHYYHGGEIDPANGVIVDAAPTDMADGTVIIDFGTVQLEGVKQYTAYKPNKGFALRGYTATPGTGAPPP